MGCTGALRGVGWQSGTSCAGQAGERRQVCSGVRWACRWLEVKALCASRLGGLQAGALALTQLPVTRR